MNCSVAQCLEVIGEWWSMLIVRDLFLGVRRFDAIQERLGISRNVLADRLDHLMAHGVVERRPYQERPVRHEYVLTDKGRALWPVLSALREWGDRYRAPEGAPLDVVHAGCGHPVHLVATCEGCGAAVGPRDVEARPGPGARAAVAPRRG
jgi:DNA-binding HxlR family transcriptional regulator